MDIPALINTQRAHVHSGGTRDLDRRRQSLRRLVEAIKSHEQLILDALNADLGKSDFEGYMTEVGMVLDEIKYLVGHLRSWARPRRIRTPLVQFPASSFSVPEPYGVVLVMAPWNYPFQLCLNPLAGAIAAGNAVVLKPSAYAPATSEILTRLLASVFDERDVAVIQGGRKENEELLEQRFDYIFFTGSIHVGKLVMEKAARYLTPVSLELGGKSPAIVDESAQIELAARRITFGKFLNAGQTCIAPDYVLVHESVEEQLIESMRREIERYFPGEDYTNLPSIVNARHHERLIDLMKDQQIVCGGVGIDGTKKILPTILRGVRFTDPVMQQEIFGPILPVITYTKLDDAISSITDNPKPLACYLFTTRRQIEERWVSEISFGGGCINDTVIHMATPYMGFGGIGESGMGSYHGKASFDTFTHYKGVVKKSNVIDLPFRYHPYDKKKERLVRLFLR